MSYPTLTPNEELAQWQSLAALDDCIEQERFCADDLREMLRRLVRAEGACKQISGIRPHGTGPENEALVLAVRDIAARAISCDGV